MKKSLISLLTLILFVFTLTSCKKSTTTSSDEQKAETGGEVTITGRIVDLDSGSGIENVVISISGGFNDRYSVSNGDFEFILDMSGNQTLTFTFEIDGYESQTINQEINVADVTIDIGNIRLAKQLVNSSVSGPPDAIQFVSLSSANISVLETGDITWTNVVYMVVDSNGNPIDIDNSIPVRFSFGAHPGGGEEIGPPVVRTNSQGIAATTIRSGTIAGPVQIFAQFTYEGNTVTSRPVKLTISGGFPVDERFAVGTTFLNYPAYGIINWGPPRPKAVAAVGDRYANPVVEGTAVYFTSTAGYIEGWEDETPEEHTDHFGIATAEIVSGPPWPNDPVFGPGFFRVIAQTVDENNTYIDDSTLVLFSAATVPIVFSPNTFNIPDLGSATINFTVQDIFGNPLSSGTTITVEANGDNISVTNFSDFEMPDVQSGNTSFSFTIVEFVDEFTGNLGTRDVSVTVTVKSRNGNTIGTISGIVN